MLAVGVPHRIRTGSAPLVTIAEIAPVGRVSARAVPSIDTCWSLIAPDDDVKVGASYVAGAEAIDVESKFISKAGEDNELRAAKYQESIAWYNGMTADMFS